MEAYILLAVGMLLTPCIFLTVMSLCRQEFRSEENRERKLLSSWPEIAVMASAELALVFMWKSVLLEGDSPLLYWMLYVMLEGMAVICITDYWERIVPNKVLLLLLLFFVLLLGFQGVRDMEPVIRLLPSVLLGVVFCLLSFGIVFMLGHGSMGAGDMKLSLVMGLLLTGEYVVGAVLYGCLAAAVYSIVQMLRKKLTRRDRIPFVPFLYVGLVLRYLAG